MSTKIYIFLFLINFQAKRKTAGCLASIEKILKFPVFYPISLKFHMDSSLTIWQLLFLAQLFARKTRLKSVLVVDRESWLFLTSIFQKDLKNFKKFKMIIQKMVIWLWIIYINIALINVEPEKLILKCKLFHHASIDNLIFRFKICFKNEKCLII